VVAGCGRAFYIVWPLIIILVLRATRPRASGAGPGHAGRTSRRHRVGGSDGGTARGRHADTSGLYYGSPGAQAGLELAGMAGALVVLWCFANVDGQSPGLYNGDFLLLAVAVAAVLASVSGVQEGALARGLSWAPLRAVGTISYGLYLWHWPVMTVLTRAGTGLSGLALLAPRLAVTFGLSTLSSCSSNGPSGWGGGGCRCRASPCPPSSRGCVRSWPSGRPGPRRRHPSRRSSPAAAATWPAPAR
jgi:hypothetical protein